MSSSSRLRKLFPPLFFLCLTSCAGFRDQDNIKPSSLPIVKQSLTIEQLWSTSVGKGVGKFYSRLQPAYLDGKVYVADRRGTVAALSLKGGQVVWQNNLQKKVKSGNDKSLLLSGGITLARDILLIGNEKAELIALRSSDGRELWRAPCEGEIIAAPIRDGERVIVNTNEGVVHSFNLADGAPLWQFEFEVPLLALRGSSRPALSDDGIVVVGGKDGQLAAIVADHGNPIWQDQIFKPKGKTEVSRLNGVVAAPLIADSTIFAAGYNGNLVALDLYSGQAAWQCSIGSATDFIRHGNVIYIVDQEDKVIAVDARSGLELWRQGALTNRQLTAPVISNGRLVVGDQQGYLHWLNLTDGSFVAQKKVDASGLYVAPLVVEGKLLVQARSGKIYCLKD